MGGTVPWLGVVFVALAGPPIMSGCVGQAELRQESAGPALRRVAQIELQETDSLYLGRPRSLLRGQSGGFYVSDLFHNRVVFYDDDGRPVRVYGRPGGGPGELRQAGKVFLFDDSTLAVSDLSRRLLNMYDVESGDFRGARKHDGYLEDVERVGRAVWFGVMDLERGTAVGVWLPDADSMSYRIPLPSEYRSSYVLAAMNPAAKLAVWSDTVLVGAQGLNSLRLFSADGSELGWMDVPSRRRRGVPPDVVDRFRPRSENSHDNLFSFSSKLMALHRQPAGSLVLVHGDLEIRSRGVHGDFYVSLVTSDRQRACVDTRVPAFFDDPQPRFAFAADTMFVLAQDIDGERVRTRITGYLLDGSSCDWLGVASGGS